MNKIMNKNAKIGIGAISLLAVVVLLYSVGVFSATECSSQSCTLSTVSATITNAVPTIDAVGSIGAVTLTAYSTALVSVNFTVTDTNGVADLDDSTAQCNFTKAGEAARINATLTANDQDTDTTFYDGNITLSWYDASGTWTVSCSVKDSSTNYVENTTTTFTINALDRVDQDATSVSFGSIAPGSNDNEATAGTTFTNGGNQNYATLQVTAHNMTDTTNIIAATQFSMDLDTAQSAGQTYLTQGSAQSLAGFTLNKCSSPCSSNSTELVYWYVDVPAVQVAGSYNDAADWTAAVST